jgi:hypothetical protein
MSETLSCLFLLALSLNPQTVREREVSTSTNNKLTETLVALKDPGAPRAFLSQQLGDEMMALAEKDHQPPRPLVMAFTDELTGALLGRKLNKDQITSVQQAIGEIMRRNESSNLEPASRLRETLAAIGVGSEKVQLVLKDLIAVGEAVRGIDDCNVRACGQ